MKEAEAEYEIRALLAAEDAMALDKIWNAYASDLFGYLVSLLCSREEAEDALQDVFVTIACKRCRLANARKLKPYLFRLTRNVALNRIKKNQRRREREPHASQWLESASGDQDDPRLDHLQTALSGLPEKQRCIIVMKYFQEKTFREIAEALGISANTAGSRYRYGMSKLKDLLGED